MILSKEFRVRISLVSILVRYIIVYRQESVISPTLIVPKYVIVMSRKFEAFKFVMQVLDLKIQFQFQFFRILNFLEF